MRNKLTNKYIIFVYVTIAATALLYWFGFGTKLYYDSNGYSLMADEFVHQGIFDFSFFVEKSEIKELFSMRGYAWPFIMAVFKVVGFKTKIGFIFCTSMFYSFGFCIALPDIIEFFYKKNVGFLGRVSVFMASFVFFPGLVKYPLSDVPALLLIVYGLYLFIKARMFEGFLRYLLFGISGLICGMAYYVRTGTIVSSALMVAVALLFSHKHFFKRVICTICLIIGICVSALPQVILNYNINGKLSYEVPISFTTGITKLEYGNGVTWLRYFSNVSGTFPDLVVVSQDDLANDLLEQEGYINRTIGPKELIKTMIKYPNEFAGIFVTKLVNSMDTRFGEVYIYDWYKKNWILGFLNILLWILGIFGLFYKINSYKLSNKSCELNYLIQEYPKIGLFMIIMAPGWFHVAGTHVEERYFYPCFVALWSFLFMASDFKALIKDLRHYFFRFAFVLALSWGICNSIWNYTMENIEHYQFFYQKHPSVKVSDNEIYVSSNESLGEIEGVVNGFKYDEATKEILMIGNCVCNSMADVKPDKRVVFVGNQYQYEYDIAETEKGFLYNQTLDPRYLYSEFAFDLYLYDLAPDEYHIYIILDYGDTQKMYDTLYNVKL